MLLLDTDGELDEKDQMKFSKILGKQLKNRPKPI